MQLKSEQSTTFEILGDTNYIDCIKKLKEQNQYLKQALQTAELLIKNYQQENHRLEIQIQIIQTKMKKIMNKQQQNNLYKMKMEIQSKRDSVDVDRNGNKKNKENYVEELNNKVKQLMVTQQKYQDKISELEHKIVILQRNNDGKKINKLQFALNSGLKSDQKNQRSQTQISCKIFGSQKKSKNLHELRVFHMKLKNQQSISDRYSENNKVGKGLVQRVFSKQKGQQSERKSSARKKIQGVPKKKHN